MGLINAHVDADTLDVYPNTQGGTWGSKGSWADMRVWDTNPHTALSYTKEFDLGSVRSLAPSVDVLMLSGDYSVQESHSNDGTTWSAYADIGVILQARYVRVRVTATGDYPIIHEVEMFMLSDRKDVTIDGLNTATLTGAYRLGVGDVRLPISETEFAAILNVQVSFFGVGPGWTYEVVDKSITPGPRIRIYNAAGNLADATIDAFIRGA